MHHSMDMDTAMRVLNAINEKRAPEPADIDLLRACAGSTPGTFTPADELACDVIQKALLRRAIVTGLDRCRTANALAKTA
jgi:hypothetical protein